MPDEQLLAVLGAQCQRQQGQAACPRTRQCRWPWLALRLPSDGRTLEPYGSLAECWVHCWDLTKEHTSSEPQSAMSSESQLTLLLEAQPRSAQKRT